MRGERANAGRGCPSAWGERANAGERPSFCVGRGASVGRGCPSVRGVREKRSVGEIKGRKGFCLGKHGAKLFLCMQKNFPNPSFVHEMFII